MTADVFKKGTQGFNRQRGCVIARGAVWFACVEFDYFCAKFLSGEESQLSQNGCSFVFLNQVFEAASAPCWWFWN